MAQTNEMLAKSILVKYNGTTIAKATGYSLEVNKEEIEISTLDSDGWKKVIGGLKSWSVSTDGLVIRGANAAGETDYHALMLDLFSNDTPLDLVITSTVSGDKAYTGKALITGLSQSGAAGEVITFSASFGGDGALAQSTVV